MVRRVKALMMLGMSDKDNIITLITQEAKLRLPLLSINLNRLLSVYAEAVPKNLTIGICDFGCMDIKFILRVLFYILLF